MIIDFRRGYASPDGPSLRNRWALTEDSTHTGRGTKWNLVIDFLEVIGKKSAKRRDHDTVSKTP